MKLVFFVCNDSFLGVFFLMMILLVNVFFLVNKNRYSFCECCFFHY